MHKTAATLWDPSHAVATQAIPLTLMDTPAMVKFSQARVKLFIYNSYII